MAQVIDTRDLIEKRDELKTLIYDSLLERIELNEIPIFIPVSYEDIDWTDEYIDKYFKDDFLDELEHIEEIDKIEEEIGSEFEYGVTLVNEDYWEEYVKEECEDCGYISKDFPTWIEIDWKATSENMKDDYIEVEYQGETYYARS